MNEPIYGALYGAAIGDALGVPVEFSTRTARTADPVTDYRGYGTWRQPPGTFSDDSSLLFCTGESLAGRRPFDPADVAKRFVRWRTNGYWGAHDAVFDVGGATDMAITQLRAGVAPTRAGGTHENSNGNGSLMRILPIAFSLRDEADALRRYAVVRDLSAITHGHVRSVFACFIYVELARQLLLRNHVVTSTLADAYRQMQDVVNNAADAHALLDPAERRLFDRVLRSDVAQLPESAIQSTGYVIHTLEAALWCLLTTHSYETAVLRAVNLGEDTDTTACVAGGLAGLYYGYSAIPTRWVTGLAKTDAIGQLAGRLAKRYQ